MAANVKGEEVITVKNQNYILSSANNSSSPNVETSSKDVSTGTGKEGSSDGIETNCTFNTSSSHYNGFMAPGLIALLSAASIDQQGYLLELALTSLDNSISATGSAYSSAMNEYNSAMDAASDSYNAGMAQANSEWANCITSSTSAALTIGMIGYAGSFGKLQVQNNNTTIANKLKAALDSPEDPSMRPLPPGVEPNEASITDAVRDASAKAQTKSNIRQDLRADGKLSAKTARELGTDENGRVLNNDAGHPERFEKEGGGYTDNEAEAKIHEDFDDVHTDIELEKFAELRSEDPNAPLPKELQDKLAVDDKGHSGGTLHNKVKSAFRRFNLRKDLKSNGGTLSQDSKKILSNNGFTVTPQGKLISNTTTRTSFAETPEEKAIRFDYEQAFYDVRMDRILEIQKAVATTGTLSQEFLNQHNLGEHKSTFGFEKEPGQWFYRPKINNRQLRDLSFKPVVDAKGKPVMTAEGKPQLTVEEEDFRYAMSSMKNKKDAGDAIASAKKEATDAFQQAHADLNQNLNLINMIEKAISSGTSAHFKQDQTMWEKSAGEMNALSRLDGTCASNMFQIQSEWMRQSDTWYGQSNAVMTGLMADIRAATRA